MAISKDLAKKMYQSKQNYTDAMYRQISNKSVWNIVLEKFPRLAEFFLTGRGKAELTVLERSFLEYIIQSEFIKPYKDGNYAEREYASPPHVIPNDPPPTDRPPPRDNPPPPDDPPPPPWEIICDAWHDGCWCANGAEQELTIYATHTITEIIQTYGCSDFIADEGQGTSTIKGRIFGCPGNRGFITYEICMKDEEGHHCCSNINIFECDNDLECCPDDKEPQCHPNNPVSIGATDSVTLSILGGVAPFTISVTGDATWEDGTTDSIENVKSRSAKIITSSSCGMAGVTWVDVCEQTISCQVRIAGGCWCGTECGRGWKAGNCDCGADNDDGIMLCHGSNSLRRMTEECDQYDQCDFQAFGTGYCNISWCQVCAFQNFYSSMCIQPSGIGGQGGGADYIQVLGSGYGLVDGVCSLLPCDDPGTYPPPDNASLRLCYYQPASYPRYKQWQCVDVCEPPP